MKQLTLDTIIDLLEDEGIYISYLHAMKVRDAYNVNQAMGLPTRSIRELIQEVLNK